MVGCTFCGSENIRPSGSSVFDAPVTRVVRALTFRRLYRCRSCDALFEAIAGGGKRSGSCAESQWESRPIGQVSVDSTIQPLKVAAGD
jgi:hypothetical protein